LVGFLILVNIIKTRKFKPSLKVILVLLFANLFWLLPYSYSAFNTAENITNSRINQFSSEEIFFRNKTFGNFQSVVALKGFMADTIELDPETFRNTYFMGAWRTLTESYLYQIVYMVFLALMIFGAVLSVFKKRLAFMPYLLTFIVGFIFLANDTPILAQFNNFIRDTFPLIGEAFRFPFTKFITVFAFSFSVLMTLGIYYLIQRFKKFDKFIFAGIFALLIIISYPAFLGNFTSPYLKLEMPMEYQELFEYMDSVDQKQRVALLPAQTFWNWQYRDWGHRGSGFSWHGIQQPIFERAFDPWSPYNEQFYNEIAFAVNTRDEILFDQLIEKYDLSYFILDQHLLNSLSQKEINYDSLRSFLNRSQSVDIEKDFGKIIVYRTNLTNEWVYSLNKKSTIKVFSNYDFEKVDSIYGLTDNYIGSEDNPSVINLFPSLFSEKLQEDLEFGVDNRINEYVLTPKKTKPYDLSDFILRVPSLFETEFLVPIEVEFTNGVMKLTPIHPEIYVNGVKLKTLEDPIFLRATKITNPSSITFVDTNHNIELDNTDKKAYLLNPALNSIKLIDRLGNTELLVLDTNTLDKRSFFAQLPEGIIKDVEIRIPKIESNLATDNIIREEQYEIKTNNSVDFAKPFSEQDSLATPQGVELLARDGSSELTFYLPNLYHAGSYIMLSNVDYNSGLPMRFYVDNDTQSKAEVESVFSKDKEQAVVVIPKTNDFFKGYGFHFISKSVGRELSSSTIKSVEIYPFPLRLLRSLQFIDKETFNRPVNLNPKIPIDNNKVNINLYEAEAKPNSYLVLSQAYDDGWRAYEISNQQSAISNQIAKIIPFVLGDELENHVVVNNWANGWETKEGGSTIIVYLPSYIQYHGQLLTIVGLIVLIIVYLGTKRKHKRHHKN